MKLIYLLVTNVTHVGYDSNARCTDLFAQLVQFAELLDSLGEVGGNILVGAFLVLRIRGQGDAFQRASDIRDLQLGAGFVHGGVMWKGFRQGEGEKVRENWASGQRLGLHYLGVIAHHLDASLRPRVCSLRLSGCITISQSKP
jgi:hypothetical protein